MPKPRHEWWYIALAPLLICASCLAKSAIWVVPGSTANHLEFGVSDTVGGTRLIPFSVLRVDRCDRPDVGPGAAWVLGLRDPYVGKKDAWPSRILYGQAPQGMASIQGPEHLYPGCYRVTISGTGRTQFLVNDDGTITETPFGRLP